MSKKKITNTKGRCMICFEKTNKEDYVCDHYIPVRNHSLKHWMKSMDKLYPKTVAKYKKIKIIVNN